MSGGLGNLLFDCSHAYTIGKKLNIPVEYYLRTNLIFKDKIRGTQHDEYVNNHYDRVFRGFDIKLTAIDVDITNTEVLHTEIKEFCQNYNNYLDNECVIIGGCWPTFEDLDEKTIQNLFAIDCRTKQDLENKYKDILHTENNVSIHVRRGDFLMYPNLTNLLDDTTYYQQAIELCRNDSMFLVISDDIEYCKNKFKGDNFIFIQNTTALEDLYIQTYCKTNIIANSTFSCWGAYLNKTKGQTIIKPSCNKYNIAKNTVKIITI